MNEIDNNLGKNIATERYQQKMTQEQLAEFSDLTINYLSKIERDQAKKISAESLYKIAQAFNVSINDLMEAKATTTKAPQVKDTYQRQLENYLSQLDVEQSENICKFLIKLIKEINSN